MPMVRFTDEVGVKVIKMRNKTAIIDATGFVLSKYAVKRFQYIVFILDIWTGPDGKLEGGNSPEIEYGQSVKKPIDVYTWALGADEESTYTNLFKQILKTAKKCGSPNSPVGYVIWVMEVKEKGTKVINVTQEMVRRAYNYQILFDKEEAEEIIALEQKGHDYLY